MLLLKLRPGSTLLRYSTFFFSNNIYFRNSLLQSQYHKQGPPSFRIASNIKRVMSRHLSSLTELQKKLDENRKKWLKMNKIDKIDAKSLKNIQDSNELTEYINSYQNLTKKIEECPLNNEWIYNIIGWYNMTEYYKPLVQKLIESKKEEFMLLIKTLSKMKHKWQNPYGRIDKDLYVQKNITNFYKRIQKYDLDLKTIVELEQIMRTPVAYSKRKFYYLVFNKNIQDYINRLPVQDTYHISHLISFMNAYVRNMNDQDQGIIALEKYIIAHKPTLSHQDYSNLMECYTLKGRINLTLYDKIIKPYIYKHKMGHISKIIQSIRFVICSQSKDNQILKVLYELIANKYQSNKIRTSWHAYNLHLYTHYLLSKGYKISLPPTLQKELNSFCKQRSQDVFSISKTLNRLKKSKKYSSNCLQKESRQVKNQSQSTEMSVFEKNFGYRLKQLQLKDYNIFYKPKFCCFELDYLLQNKKKEWELIDIEIQGIQYIFTSGRLIRQRQIRDQILQHYGIKVNHLDYNRVKGQQKIDPSQLLMYKGNDSF